MTCLCVFFVYFMVKLTRLPYLIEVTGGWPHENKRDSLWLSKRWVLWNIAESQTDELWSLWHLLSCVKEKKTCTVVFQNIHFLAPLWPLRNGLSSVILCFMCLFNTTFPLQIACISKLLEFKPKLEFWFNVMIQSFWKDRNVYLSFNHFCENMWTGTIYACYDCFLVFAQNTF